MKDFFDMLGLNKCLDFKNFEDLLAELKYTH